MSINMIDPGFLNLVIGLLILIIVNVILGSSNAIFESSFDFIKFIKGIGKGILVAICFLGVYVAGILNPEIIAISINGQLLTITAAVYSVVLFGYYFYAKQVFEKMSELLNSKKIIGSVDEKEGE